ncbi:MAG: phage tail protein [Bacteroidota bacterium]
MKSASPNTPEFYFELSTNEENIPFREVEGVSTEVALKHMLTDSENPFKYRVPSLPKTGHLTLKNGTTRKDSKLMQWCAAHDNPNAEQPAGKRQAVLHLKDASGNSVVEWTLWNAYPIRNQITPGKAKSNDAGIDDLELGYSFYTLARK